MRKGVSLLIASDRCAHITDDMLNDFRAAMPGVSIDKVSAAHKFHDRYILVDFKTKSEKLYHCGASSKDAGNKITTIVQLDDVEAYRNMFEELYERYRMLRTMQLLSSNPTQSYPIPPNPTQSYPKNYPKDYPKNYPKDYPKDIRNGVENS